MAKFSIYKIPLKSLSQEIHIFEYELDDKFFEAIDGDEIKKGKVNVLVSVRRTMSTFELNFELNGVVQVPCTRCLDTLHFVVEAQNRLIVKFGVEYSEESDEIVIIPESEGEINIAWYLYEFIVLSIPIKHVHAPGECSKLVTKKLHKHKAVSADGEEDDFDTADDEFVDDDILGANESDPRWDALKGLGSSSDDTI